MSNLNIFLNILPTVVRKNIRIFSYENACGFCVALQMVKHPSGHISVGQMKHILMFCARDSCSKFEHVSGNSV
ncbi:MAG: hypothetical protein J6K85_01245, partial [Clostridia bacterium]|nr:hypothetical protein [Clostridia bacterium]